MKNWGIALILLGGFAAIVALTVLPSTVSSEEMTALPYTGSVIGSGRYTETYNMPRAQLRELIFHGGGFVFLAGILLFVGGTVEERLRSAGLRLAEPMGSQEGRNSTPDAPADATLPAAPIYDFEAAEAAAIKNKEMVAWAFGAIVVLIVSVLVVAQLYGPK